MLWGAEQYDRGKDPTAESRQVKYGCATILKMLMVRLSAQCDYLVGTTENRRNSCMVNAVYVIGRDTRDKILSLESVVNESPKGDRASLALRLQKGYIHVKRRLLVNSRREWWRLLFWM